MSAQQITTLPDLSPLFRSLPGLYVALSPDLTVLETTTAYLRARRMSREALLYKPLVYTSLTDSYTNFSLALQDSLEHVLLYKEPHQIPAFRFTAAPPELSDGTPQQLYWSVINTPVLDDDGALLYILHEAREISELNPTDVERNKKETLPVITNNSVKAVSWEYDLVHNKMYWGAGLQDILGYTPDEMGPGGESWDERVHPEDFEEIQASIEKANASGSKIWTGEYRFRKADGTYIPVLDQGYIIYHADGRPIRTLGSIIDLSDSHKAEEELKESDTRYRHLLEVLPHMAWMSGPDGKVLYFNSNWYSYTGMTSDQTEGWTKAIHPEDTATILMDWNNTMMTGCPYEVEYRLLNHYDKQYRWFLERGVPMHGLDGKIQFWIGTLTDIEDQKQVLERIREKDLQLESILNHSPVHFCLLHGPDHICQYVTPGVDILLGYRSRKHQPAHEVFPELAGTNFFNILDEVYRTGKKVQVTEYKLQVDRLRNGELTEVYLNVEYRPVMTGNKPEGILISAVDVTELVKTKQQVAYKQYSMQLLSKATGTATWDHDVKANTLYWSKSYKDMFGYSDDDLEVSSHIWDEKVHPDDYDTVREGIDAAIAQKRKSWTGEYRYRCADGNYATLLDHGYIIYGDDGKPERMLGSVVDVTRQKKRDQELHYNSERFKRIAIATNDVIWDWNLKDDSIWWNEGYTSLFGHTSGDNLLINSWTDHIHPDDYKPVKDSILSTINGTTNTWSAEYRFRCADGTYKLIVDKGIVIRDEQGKGIRMFGSMLDITEKRRIELALHESNTHTRKVLESLPLMTWTATPDGAVNYYNQRWYDYTGITFDELKDWGWEKALHPDDAARTKVAWEHALKTKNPFEIENRWRSGDQNGKYRWFLARAVPIRNSEGEITMWVGSHTDIEDHKKAEEELLEKNLELERINRDLDSFVYTASHDLKLPIVNMAGIFNEITRSTEFKDADGEKLVGMFNKSLEQIYNTINELGEVVKIQKKKVRDHEPVVLQELIENVSVSIHDMIQASGAKIKTDFAQTPVINFSRPNLNSIFYNLLSNALKYRHPERQPVIQMTTTLKGDYIELKVQDNGLGIDMNKHQSKLFQMFKRFHNHVNGSGLGLYIVNRLLTNNGGYVNIESTLNEGTTFYLYFKQKKA